MTLKRLPWPLLIIFLLCLNGCSGAETKDIFVRLVPPCQPQSLWQKVTHLSTQVLDNKQKIIYQTAHNPKSQKGFSIDPQFLSDVKSFEIQVKAFVNQAIKIPILIGSSGLIEIGSKKKVNSVILLGALNQPFKPAQSIKGECKNLGLFPTGSKATKLPNGKLLISGGFLGGVPSRQSFILDTFTWTISVESPSHIGSDGSKEAGLISRRAHHSSTLLDDGSVLIYGGEGPSSTLRSAEIYNPNTNQFNLITNPSQIWRSQHIAVKYGDRVFMIGGKQVNKNGTNYPGEVEEFNLKTKKFNLLPQMKLKQGRVYFAHALIGNEVMIMGGRSGLINLDSIEVADLNNKVVLNFPAKLPSGGVSSATILNDKTLILFQEKCVVRLFSYRDKTFLSGLGESCANFFPLASYNFGSKIFAAFSPEGSLIVESKSPLQVNFKNWHPGKASPAIKINKDLIYLGSENSSWFFKAFTQ